MKSIFLAASALSVVSGPVLAQTTTAESDADRGPSLMTALSGHTP